MPTYVYKFVKTGETIEVQQGFHDITLTTIAHPRTGRKMSVKKVFTPVGVTFRGDGFYKTDSRAKAKGAKKAAGGESSSSSDTKSDNPKSETSKPDSSATAKKSETASASTP